MATPGQPEPLVLRTTFGLLISRDAGTSWEWACAEAIGVARQEPSAPFWPAAGCWRLSAGLAHASDSCCAWQFASLSDTPLELVDLTVRPLEPSSAVALAWERTDANAGTPGVPESLVGNDGRCAVGSAPGPRSPRGPSLFCSVSPSRPWLGARRRRRSP